MSEQFRLQMALASSTATSDGHDPHHPILCQGRLSLDEDGRLSCEHTTVGPDDRRTHYCVDHSIALLLIELARQQ